MHSGDNKGHHGRIVLAGMLVLIVLGIFLMSAASGKIVGGGGGGTTGYIPNELRKFSINFSEHSTIILTGDPIPLRVQAWAFDYCLPGLHVFQGNENFVAFPLSDYQFGVRLGADCGPECLRYPPTWIGHIYETSEESQTRIYTTDARGVRDLEFISMQPGNYTITIEGVKFTRKTYPCPNNGLNMEPPNFNLWDYDLSKLGSAFQADPVTTTITVISPPPSGGASWSESPSERFSAEIHAWPLTVQTGKPSRLEVIVWKDGLPEIGREIEITSSGGTIETPFGKTDAAGIYTTNFTAGLEGTYFVTARSARGEEEASSTTAIKVVKGPVLPANGGTSDPGFSPTELLEGDQRIPSRLQDAPGITLHAAKTHIRPSEITSIDVAVIDCVRPEYDAEISVFVNGKMDHTETVKTSCRLSSVTTASFPFSSKEEGVFVIGAQGTNWQSPTPPTPTGIKVYVSSNYSQPQAGEPKGILDMILSIPAQIVGLFSGGPAISGSARETVPVVQPAPTTILPVRTADATRTVRVVTPLSQDEVPGQEIVVPPSACRAGYISCNRTCVDPMSDPDHCGTCAMACRSPASCRNGTCIAPLVSPAVPATGITSPPVDCGKMGLTNCGGSCVDIETSSLHCGSCSHSCPSPSSCRDGVCTAVTIPQTKPSATVTRAEVNCGILGKTTCGGTCVDLQTDQGNCGSCGSACQSPASCRNGMCIVSTVQPSKPTVTVTKPPVNCEILGKASCSGTCVDVLTDWNNCGSCGRACPTGNTCEGGKCCMPMINPLTHTIQKVCEP